MSAKRLAELRAGLLYCSPAHQPVIQAMIDKLEAELRSRANAGDPATVANDPAGIDPVSRLAGGRTPVLHRESGEAQTSASGVTAGETATDTEGWRLARKALRQAGHLVEQQGGIVYVDGKRCDDPALQAV